LNDFIKIDWLSATSPEKISCGFLVNHLKFFGARPPAMYSPPVGSHWRAALPATEP
jgi:hypothetical protein